MKQLVADIREMFGEQVRYRELLFQMTQRDLMLRYKQAVMGFAWAVFMPLINTVVFSVIFMRVAAVETPVPYPLFAYCGLSVWTFFSNSLRFATISLSTNSVLVSKVYFPREIFPVSAIMVCAVDFGVSLSILVALMIYYGIAPGAAALTLPFILVIQVMFTLALGLILGMANVFYRDVKYLIEAALMIWMFASSVVYPLSHVDGWLGFLLALNPLTIVIDAFRSALLLNQTPDPLRLAGAALASFACLLGAWLWFHRSEFKFAEAI